MKRILFFLLCIQSLSYSTPIHDRTIDPCAIEKLTSAFNISSDEDIITATQKSWLRNPGKERWELTELNPEQKKFVINWAEEQGIYSQWKPSEQFYDKALILGATTGIMKKRLDYLVQLWKEGVRFNEIVWLTGDRPLDFQIDEPMLDCQNESQAAQAIWKQETLPEGMKDIPVVFIAVPMKMENGQQKRPVTQDTLVAWLEQSPKPCKALFISDQPFCGYQSAIVKATLPEKFLFETVGPGVDPTSHPAAAAITLDSIARWIYTERSINSNYLKKTSSAVK